MLSSAPTRASCSVDLPLKTVLHFTLLLTEIHFFSGDVPSSRLSSLDFPLWLRIRSRLVFVCSVSVKRERKEELIYCSNNALNFWVPLWYPVPISNGLPTIRPQILQHWFLLWLSRWWLLLHYLGKTWFQTAYKGYCKEKHSATGVVRRNIIVNNAVTSETQISSSFLLMMYLFRIER